MRITHDGRARTATAIAAAAAVPAIAIATAAQPSNVPAPGPTASVVWQLPGESVGRPTHDDDTAYFLSKGREVVAIQTDTGVVRWRSGTGVASTDAIFGDTTAGTAVRLAGDTVVAGDWDVVGFDRRTGTRRWIYEAPNGDGPGLFLGATAGDVVYTGSPDGRMYAIDAARGRLLWTTHVVDTPGVRSTLFEPVVDGEFVAATYSTYNLPGVGGVVVVDAASGRLRWKTEFPKPRESWQSTIRAGGPVWVDDLLIAAATDGNLYAFDAATGVVRWAFPRLDGPFSGAIASPDIDQRALVRAGRLIVAGSTTGLVVAYDVDTRRERWRHDAGYWGSPTFSLAADDRLAYLPFFGGFIVAVDLTNGQEQWRFGDFRMGFLWAPSPHGDKVYASASSAGFYALATRRPGGQP
ncbi:MAG: PQQ-binding-like beta-propeller repeat protein [Vicinamibacterales bacterium]